jgi:hypothetical protein
VDDVADRVDQLIDESEHVPFLLFNLGLLGFIFGFDFYLLGARVFLVGLFLVSDQLPYVVPLLFEGV